jgi:hypothetical protein
LANNNEISNADVNALITFYELKNLPNGANQRRMLLTNFLGAEIYNKAFAQSTKLYIYLF